MYKVIMPLLCLLLACAVVEASDLYRVTINSEFDAENLRQTGARAIVKTGDGYLVLIDSQNSSLLEKSGLKADLLANAVERENLALDIDHDPAKSNRFEIVYSEDNLRLFIVDGDIIDQGNPENQVAPILSDYLPIEYSQPTVYNSNAVATIADLDSLMELVSQDSLTSYDERLQAFYRRVAGTDSNYAASEWLASKFDDFGYDSVVYDSFWARVYGENKTCRNVVATKVGSRHPEWQIIVGAHFDAVPGSPGADDNGSGTAGVLEIARILADVETDMTFIFIPFDAEETGLDGSWHYSNAARARGDHIVYMLNMDMIGQYTNSDRANLYYGDETVFSELWADIADSLAGITASFRGTSGGSDHYPFTQNDFQATFVQEYYFSEVYHTNYDSTTYMDFEYMTRMVKASLATVYAVNVLPPAVIINSVVDVGDGQSLQVNWVEMDPERIDHFWLYYWPEGSSIVDSIYIPGAESSIIVSGLAENHPHHFYMLPFNADGQTSVGYETATGVPHMLPTAVTGLEAMTIRYGIELSWNSNPELDIDHYRVIRDGTVLDDIIAGTSFVDDDPELGKLLHTYKVMAVDIDDNASDTVATSSAVSKAAWLDEGRILAINRSHESSGEYLVDEAVTGDYIRQALAGLDYVYYSDTSHTNNFKISDLSLYDLIDYELVIIGGESARLDDLAESPTNGGRLDTLAYYLSLGGKAIVFGRWGELDFEATIGYDPGSPRYTYNQYFGIAERNLVRTTSSGSELQSDLIGAHSQVAGYPDLPWDSLAAANHSTGYTDVTGIPCVAYPTLDQAGIEILYTYNSSDDGGLTEGQPMAWRNTTLDYQYAYFELPLSFMERNAAVAALSKVVSEFGFSGAKTVSNDVPGIWADPGEMSHIYLGNLTGYTPSDIDAGSIVINEVLAPLSTSVLSYHPDFEGEVLEVTVASVDFAHTFTDSVDSYEMLVGDGYNMPYTMSWNYVSEVEQRSASGAVIVDGYICGDANTDGTVNVGDVVNLIQFIFKGGPGPYPYMAGDVNADGHPSVGDAVYLVGFIFKGGPDPVCPRVAEW